MESRRSLKSPRAGWTEELRSALQSKTATQETRSIDEVEFWGARGLHGFRNPVAQLASLRQSQRTAVLKILRVVNLLRVVFLVRRGDLLSRRTLCGHHFPGELQTFFLSKKGPRRTKFGGRSKNTTA